MKWVMKQTKDLGATVIKIPSLKPFNDSTVAQLIRLYAWREIKHDNDYILTSDVDLLPLKRDFFYQDAPDYKMHFYYGNIYVDQGEMKFPIGYLGGSRATWRELFPETYTQQLVQGLTAKKAQSQEAWFFDEVVFGKKIEPLGIQPAHAEFKFGQVIRRNGCPPSDRLDRSAWDWSGRGLDSFVDAHCPRPGFGSAWADILPVLNHVGIGEWAQNYREEFTRYV